MMAFAGGAITVVTHEKARVNSTTNLSCTNFITTIAQTRVYPANFSDIFKKLKDKSKIYFK